MEKLRFTRLSNSTTPMPEIEENSKCVLSDVIKSVCQCCGKRTIDYFNTKCKSCGTEHAYKQTVL
jgi:hypothetical protein